MSAQYLITAITKAFSTFTWGQNSFNEEIIKATRITLPVIESADADHDYTARDIDWNYMQDYIEELMRKQIAKLDAYLKPDSSMVMN